MPLEGEYEPSSWDWVREQVEEFEASGGQRANTFADTGLPIIVMTNRGNKKRPKLRKTPLMRVEHEGEYALIASVGGAPQNPVWYHNLKADPQVTVQDGAEVIDAVAEEVDGDERTAWWDRAVAAYSDYQVYQDATERRIPVFRHPPHPEQAGGERPGSVAQSATAPVQKSWITAGSADGPANMSKSDHADPGRWWGHWPTTSRARRSTRSSPRGWPGRCGAR